MGNKDSFNVSVPYWSVILCGFTKTNAHFPYIGNNLTLHQVKQANSVCCTANQRNGHNRSFILKTSYATTGKTTYAVTQFKAQRIGKGYACAVVHHLKRHPQALIGERMRDAQSHKSVKYGICCQGRKGERKRVRPCPPVFPYGFIAVKPSSAATCEKA